MTRYSSALKASILKRMMPPNPVSIPVLRNETGIPIATLYNWRVRVRAQHQGHAVPATANTSEHWSAKDKLAISI